MPQRAQSDRDDTGVSLLGNASGQAQRGPARKSAQSAQSDTPPRFCRNSAADMQCFSPLAVIR